MSKNKDELNSRSNNTWYHYDDEVDTAVIFVHGFFSSSASCWVSKTGTFWPELLLKDTRLPSSSIFLGGYYTSIASGEYSIRDCANELFGSIKRADELGRRSPSSFRNLVFVCHSLGGIVTRYLLESNRDAFKGKRIGLCLMASPSLGSDYATTFLGIARFYKNAVGKQLRLGSTLLRDLDDRFVQFLEAQEPGSFFGVEAIEHHSVFLIPFLPDFKPIVSKGSAARYFGTRSIIPGTNHSTIVKPESLSHQSHLFLVDFMSRMPASAQRASSPSPVPAKYEENAAVLFDAYDKTRDKYYLVREIDDLIERSASLRSIWVFGSSGMGKTCSLRRYATLSDAAQIDICLAQCAGPDPKALLVREMLDTLVLLGHAIPSIERTYANLAAVLSTIANQIPAIVVLDEVPTSEINHGVATELVGLIYDLSVTTAARGKRAKFIVSSLAEPALPPNLNGHKFNELVQFVRLDDWSPSDLAALTSMIVQALPHIQLSENFRAQLPTRCLGSPRLLKTFFRNLWVRGSTSPDPEIVLQDTLAQLTY